ncbi:MAG: 23S rRNA (uracil(1939)-C(5))-methyltransferase RlmD [Defluviitaleaceae bacterium]|nr:23S rRNA (uracil(1939)-C(5))-methyltransferase RlmD [Defluviitaleaceae bacterium]
MKKYSVLEIQINSIKFPNIGLAKVEGAELEVKGALPGQRLSVRIVKKGKVNKANILEVLEPAPQEIAPECAMFGLCGGCAFQNIPYDYELELKTNMVKQILSELYIEDKFLPSIGSPTHRYRNKMEYSFGDDGESGNLTLGMRKKGSYYEAIDATGCLLAHEDFGKIVAVTLEYFRKNGEMFYHRKKETGTLRHLVIRHGINSKEILVNLVTTGGKDYSEYANVLLGISLENSIVGIINTVSNSIADAIVPDEVKILHGRDYYYERFAKCGHDMTYKVPLFSFFQTNGVMVSTLYGVIAQFAGDLGDKTVFDLYCGAGTIGLFLAARAAESGQSVKKILGIEIVEAAIISARENAALNANICEFIAGDVRKVVQEITESPDIIILDPPREGINPKAIPSILAFGAQKIIYVSCKPTSLAVNLPAFLEGGYEVSKIQCVDMFPRTANIEVVVELTLQR